MELACQFAIFQLLVKLSRLAHGVCIS